VFAASEMKLSTYSLTQHSQIFPEIWPLVGLMYNISKSLKFLRQVLTVYNLK